MTPDHWKIGGSNRSTTMTTKRWIALAGVALALLIAVVLAPAVLAQGPGPGYRLGGGMGSGGTGPGYGRGMGGVQQSLVAVAADTLNMTQVDLVTMLRNGRTIAQVAAERNVAPTTIVDAFVSTRQARMAEAVTAGRMTQAQADTMLATMRANVTARLNQPGTAQGGGPGSGFVDEDGDGVCDHAGSGPMGNGPRAGRPQGGPRGHPGR
jgi:hypothetical protein